MDRMKKVNTWKELVDFVESINPYENTIVLTGFINEWEVDDSIHIKQLIFETRPVKQTLCPENNCVESTCLEPIDQIEDLEGKQ
jgi:hypothetical protein